MSRYSKLSWTVCHIIIWLFVKFLNSQEHCHSGVLFVLLSLKSELVTHARTKYKPVTVNPQKGIGALDVKPSSVCACLFHPWSPDSEEHPGAVFFFFYTASHLERLFICAVWFGLLRLAITWKVREDVLLLTGEHVWTVCRTGWYVFNGPVEVVGSLSEFDIQTVASCQPPPTSPLQPSPFDCNAKSDFVYLFLSMITETWKVSNRSIQSVDAIRSSVCIISYRQMQLAEVCRPRPPCTPEFYPACGRGRFSDKTGITLWIIVEIKTVTSKSSKNIDRTDEPEQLLFLSLESSGV